MYAQLAASIEKVFRCLDADGNGLLDRNELKAGFAAMVRLCQRIPNHDIMYVLHQHVYPPEAICADGFRIPCRHLNRLSC
jgi:hypothetical protein